ncbi:MAG: glycosyltransferase family 2 protein [Myxococcota bacterium]
MPETNAADDRHRPSRIAVVIVNYRTPALVAECIDTVLPEIDPVRDVVVIVDNASGDDSVPALEALLARHPGAPLRLVVAEHNGGFAAGNNLGIAAAPAQAHLLLNSDTWLRPGAVEALWKRLGSGPRVGLVGPRLEWPDGEPQVSCFRLHTPASELIDGARTGWVRRLLQAYDVPLPVRDHAFRPEWVSFAAVLVRSEVWRAIGPMDEGFFLYYEDVDVCRRARDAGFQAWYEPAARVVHLRGGSGPVKQLAAAGKRRPRYFYAARKRYFRNAYGPLGPWIANLCWSVGRVLSWLRGAFGTDHHTVRREWVDLWRG